MITHILASLLLTCLATITVIADNILDEISIEEAPLTVMLNGKTRELCHKATEYCKNAGYHFIADKHLLIMLDSSKDEFDYKTVLKALNACLNLPLDASHEEECNLLDSIKQQYDILKEEYSQLQTQLSTRRIRCKCYTKVVARELAACNAVLKEAIVTDRLIVKGCLQIPGLNGIVRTSGGCFSATPLNASDIPNGFITNNMLAQNSVTGGPGGTIANSTITPSNLAFNTVQTFATETNPLIVYRGTVAAAGTAPISGTGFSVTHTDSTGVYTVTFTNAYSSATSYQFFVQPDTGYGNTGTSTFISLSNQTASSITVNTFSDLGAPTDANFFFFAIGS